MHKYLVSFRFEYDDGYSDRYDSFIETIETLFAGRHWYGTTSVYVFASYKTASEIADTLAYTTKFDVTKDQLVVISLEHIHLSETRGNLENENVLLSILGADS